MSLGLFNCRLIQLGGDRLFFFTTGTPFATASLRFLLSRLVGRSGRCQGRAVLARRSEPLTPPRPSIECPWKATGRSDAENLGHPNRRCRTVVETLPVVELEVALDTRSRRSLPSETSPARLTLPLAEP